MRPVWNQAGFAYSTFSSVKDKFRVVFVMGNELRMLDYERSFKEAFFRFPEADNTVVMQVRMFFGGKDITAL